MFIEILKDTAVEQAALRTDNVPWLLKKGTILPTYSIISGDKDPTKAVISFDIPFGSDYKCCFSIPIDSFKTLTNQEVRAMHEAIHLNVNKETRSIDISSTPRT